MKGLSFFGKAIFFVNSVFAILLVFGYALPYIPPHIFPKLSVLSLLLPVLLLINAVFLLYWVLRGKRQLFLSVILQALLDATKEKIPNEKIRTTYDRDRAKAWFLVEVGVTCQNFEDVCGMAGVNPEVTRTFAYQVVNSKKKNSIRKQIKNILGGENE